MTEPTTEPRPVRALLDELLTIEARMAGLAQRGGDLRVELEARARKVKNDDGVAPTWRAPGLGTASFSDPQPKVVVKDEPALASWVAQRHPTEATATITVPGDTDTLERALAALAEEEVTIAGVVTTIRPAWLTDFVKGCAAPDEAPSDEVWSADGEKVDGLYLAPAAVGRLSVRLDPEAKARAIAELGDPLAAGILIRPIGELGAPVDQARARDIGAAILEELDAPRDVHGDRINAALEDLADEADGEPDYDSHPVDAVVVAPLERTEAEEFNLPAGDTLDQLKVAQLRVLLINRHLPKGGNRPDLVERLRAWHKQQGAKVPA